MLETWITVILLGFLQNMSFSLISRSRNRDNMYYHAIAAIMGNTVYFLTIRELVLAEMSWILFVPYAIGTASGSVFGARVSMIIEKAIGAKADG